MRRLSVSTLVKAQSSFWSSFLDPSPRNRCSFGAARFCLPRPPSACILRGNSAERAKSPTPMAAPTTKSSDPVLIFDIQRWPSALLSSRAATSAATSPCSAEFTADTTATLTVELISDVGTDADAAPQVVSAASDPDDRVKPRRERRLARIRRALDSRAERVPTGHPSCVAASLCPLPSRWQRMIGSPITSRKPAQLLVEPLPFRSISMGCGKASGWGELGRAPVPSFLAWRPPCQLGLDRRLPSHAVEPVGKHFSWHDRRCLAGEDEERGLKGVLGVVVMSEDHTANAPD